MMNRYLKCPRGKNAKCSNVMMNRHLKCPRGKNEKMLKCDHESPFEMPAWKKWKNAQMWWWIVICNAAWKKWKNAQMRWWSVEKMERCSNVMMLHHLKCQRRKSENILKCDHESPLDMPAWKKWKNTRMWGWISRAYRMAIHHRIWAFCHFFHVGISNGDSSSHLSICLLFPRGHIKWRFIITFLHYFIFSTRTF